MAASRFVEVTDEEINCFKEDVYFPKNQLCNSPFRLYILFSQFKSCDNTQEDWSFVLGNLGHQSWQYATTSGQYSLVRLSRSVG